MFERLRDKGFDVLVKNHAAAILASDFAEETEEFITAIEGFQLPVSELIGSGGGEAASTQRLRRRLSDVGWLKHNFMMETKIDGVIREAISHEIDHVRRCDAGTIALEIEWNNKDPFFDRDLENFHRLHAQSVISVGVIVTRGVSLQTSMHDLVASFLRDGGYESEEPLQAFGMKARTARQRSSVEKAIRDGSDFADAFAKQFVADKFGAATTHWNKLMERVARGVGNPCPLLLVGLPKEAVRTDYSAAEL